MKTLFALLTATLFASTARGQFPIFPAADRVLGAPTFTSVSSGAATSSTMLGPTGLAIDSTSGKLFISSSHQNRILRFPDAAALANGADAEAVLGQIDFSGTSSGLTATTLGLPYGIHVDANGRLWVADSFNNRVLMFANASTASSGAAAALVLGQPNFTTRNTAHPTSTQMSSPSGVFVDAADNLWVADSLNSRVLKFAKVSTLANGAAATVVLGQANFEASAPATSAVAMRYPVALSVDAAGRLWVADLNTRRVLRYDDAANLANGVPASAVLGKPDFTTDTRGTSARDMSTPSALLVDPDGTLYVSDFSNNRILIFRNAAAKPDGDAADAVIGQPDFTSESPGMSERHLSGPLYGLAMDGAGRLWASDFNNYRALRFSPDRNATPPTLTGRVPRRTSRRMIMVKGTAADENGVAEVRYRISMGTYRTAAGTTSWSFTARLKPGKNTIEIVMVDEFGNVSGAKRVKVTRR